MRVLITGANGFLGSHIVEKSLQNGHETFAAIRSGSNTNFIDNLNGCIVTHFDYTDSESLDSSLKKNGPFDLIIHNAGLTKSFSLDRYLGVNVSLTGKLLEAVKSSNALKPGGQFVYISSMAAKGPVGNNGPASYYGESKLKAEELIKGSGLNYMIFRPTGIYGARDTQFLPLFKFVRLGLYPKVTSTNHKMTLINARDVASNVLNVSVMVKNKIIHLDDGNVYHHNDLKSTIEGLMNKKSKSFQLPRGIVLIILSISDFFDRLLKRVPAVSVEQYKEISQDWDFDFTEERKNIPLTIEYPISEGFKDALNYYRIKKLL